MYSFRSYKNISLYGHNTNKSKFKTTFLMYLFLTSYIFKDSQESDQLKKDPQDHINIFFHDPKVCMKIRLKLQVSF